MEVKNATEDLESEHVLHSDTQRSTKNRDCASWNQFMNVNNAPQSQVSHGLMLPPPGYKFIPKSDRVCDKSGCFECYDIYCQRCESKDRRILELEMRNNEMAKYIAHLSSLLFPKGDAEAVLGKQTPVDGRGSRLNQTPQATSQPMGR